MQTLKLRVIIIILPTNRREIIFLTAHTAKNKLYSPDITLDFLQIKMQPFFVYFFNELRLLFSS